MKKGSFVTQSEAQTEEFQGRTNDWLCRPEIAEADHLQICRASLPVGEGHHFHLHPELEEAIYVLEGVIEQWIEMHRRVTKPG